MPQSKPMTWFKFMMLMNMMIMITMMKIMFTFKTKKNMFNFKTNKMTTKW